MDGLKASLSVVFFERAFLAGSEKPMAKMMGVKAKPLDYALFAATNLYVLPQMLAHTVALCSLEKPINTFMGFSQIS